MTRSRSSRRTRRAPDEAAGNVAHISDAEELDFEFSDEEIEEAFAPEEGAEVLQEAFDLLEQINEGGEQEELPPQPDADAGGGSTSSSARTSRSGSDASRDETGQQQDPPPVPLASSSSESSVASSDSDESSRTSETSQTNISAMTLFTRQVGQPRVAVDLAAAQVKVKKEDRGSGKDKLKNEERATYELPRKFHLMSFVQDETTKPEVDGDSRLGNVYDTERRIDELRARLTEYDMLTPCFSEMQKVETKGSTAAYPVLSSVKYDLLLQHENLTLDEVKDWTEAILLYGSDADVESLRWSRQLLENSCDPELRDQVSETFSKFDSRYKGGTTYFKVMMEAIVTTTEDAVKNMVKLLETANLKKIRGENVRTLVSLMRGALTRLGNLTPSRVPSNVVELALNAMCTASSKDFTDIFVGMKTLQKQNTFKVNMVSADDLKIVESIFADAIRNYDSELLLDRWVGKDDTSAYKNGPGCWNCGKEDHFARDCPQAEEHARWLWWPWWSWPRRRWWPWRPRSRPKWWPWRWPWRP